MLNIPIILGSVREGRKSEAAAKYIHQKVRAAGHESILVDFKELSLPFYNGPTVPVVYYKKGYPNENAQKWSNIARAADAFIIVTPEYNHGYPAVLKNALDWLYTEFERKPFGLVGVSNGTVSGARVIEQLRTIIENFAAVAMRETIMIGPVEKYFNDEGQLLEPALDKKIEGLLGSLTWWAETLKNRKYADTDK
ncbi:MAG: NAD(P)H-dependent oxidoreductase [Candidatus Doudnabacteria bacterium]|nr:NAD(P)H-dependent oxidoreductase [Candidatus Doudnabacteria bacterium]